MAIFAAFGEVHAHIFQISKQCLHCKKSLAMDVNTVEHFR
jgi:hypothetical protein